MKRAIVAIAVGLLLPGALLAGDMWGRILTSEGRPLAEQEVRLQPGNGEGDETFTTTRFGRYEVELADGAYDRLEFTIDGRVYVSDEVEIYGRTEVSWRMVESEEEGGQGRMLQEG